MADMRWQELLQGQCCYVIIMIQNTDPLREIIRYEELLKATSQRIEIIILDNKPEEVPILKELISEEEQLIKYLEVETTRLNPQSKQVYMRNMSRFRKKAKEHRDYIATNHGRSALPAQSQQATFMDYQKQNAYLAQNKLTMYDNQRVQESMGRQLHYQGDQLAGGIDRNREIRMEADRAESSIDLIKFSIMKRKVMFGVLVGLFVVSVIAAIIVKANKK